jgi:hypothetical protein
VSDRFVVKPATVALAVVGVVLFIVAAIYVATAAQSLPAFFPGHQAGLTRHHYTHGLAAAALGVLAWIGAWFTTAPGKQVS